MVVMNTTDYLREGYRQLSDTQLYTKLSHDSTQEIATNVTKTLTLMKQKGLISEKNFDHLNPADCTEARFYMLPKIHKKGVPGRPICSSVNHPTSRISKLVDEHIKKYVPQTKSYIRDTQDFIKKIKDLGPIPEGAILCTLDVSSLYTNIPNNEGILAVAEKLRNDPMKTPIASFILDLLKLVLYSMSFTFNGDHYLQTGGTAMGTSLAPNYANLFMDRFETKALAGFPLKPLTWKRFIDDCFMVWTHGEESLKNFIEYYSSAHPQSVLTKGPFGQYLRLRRICTLDSDFEANAKKLTGFYLNRGYPFQSLKRHYLRARKFNQDELLNIVSKETKEAPVMVTQFNPRNPVIGSLVRNNWNIIQNTEELTQIFNIKPLIGFRRLPNLRDILTSSTISYPPKPSTESNKSVHIPICTRLGKCTYCPRIRKVDQITSFHTNQVFKCKHLPPKHKVTCELTNLIYIINCKKMWPPIHW